MEGRTRSCDVLEPGAAHLPSKRAREGARRHAKREGCPHMSKTRWCGSTSRKSGGIMLTASWSKQSVITSTCSEFPAETISLHAAPTLGKLELTKRLRLLTMTEGLDNKTTSGIEGGRRGTCTQSIPSSLCHCHCSFCLFLPPTLPILNSTRSRYLSSYVPRLCFSNQVLMKLFETWSFFKSFLAYAHKPSQLVRVPLHGLGWVLTLAIIIRLSYLDF
jgi:hypothetical protein